MKGTASCAAGQGTGSKPGGGAHPHCSALNPEYQAVCAIKRVVLPPALQAKALGEHLVVGLIPDSEIRRCKGPPVMSDAERHTMVESVKWVDEVITGGF